jgi:Fic family protein
MVSIKEKTFGKKKYLYAEYSFRLPDNNIKKISKIIKEKKDIEKNEIRDYFLKKETEAYQSCALDLYKPGSILTKEKISKIESIRVEYKHILRKLTKNQMKDVLDRFTVNFTYESNAIEGNSLTLKDVTMVLKENNIPKGADLRDIYETRNTREANELLFKNKIKINVKDIIKVHSLLVKETGVNTGFKKIPNFLLMRDVKTTSPEKVEEGMNNLIDWYNSSKRKEHPLKLASEFHARFEKIHPFEDGNGRVGRLLVNAILLENDYPPLIIRKTMRQSYFSALDAYDKGYKDKLYRFLIKKFQRTFNEFFQVYVKYL